MSDAAPKAVFLSYASQDTEAAKKICEALCAAGVEVWFDQSELRGGDAWDAKIRRQIRECALFVPIISANTNARGEGYFRLEWKLAVDRSHLMARDQPFLFPLVIDDTANEAARVPDEFHAVQWARLPGGTVPPAFAGHVKSLLTAGTPPPGGSRRETGAAPARADRSRLAWVVVAGSLALAVTAVLFWPRPSAPQPEAARPSAVAAPRVAAPVPESEARQLVVRGRALLEQYVVDDTLRENLTLAEELAKRATQLDVTDGEAWALSSLVAGSYIVTARDRSTSRYMALRTDAEKAIKLAPDSDEVKFALAAAYRLQVSMRPEAERMMRNLVQRVPTDKRYLRMLGIILRNNRAYPEALEFFARAAALPGSDARAWLYRAEVLDLMGQGNEAVAAADRSLAVQPTGAAGLFKVISVATAGDFATARTYLAQVPPTVLLDDRGAAVAAYVWLWSHEPDKAIAVLSAIPAEDFYNTFYVGPKSAFLGFAYQLAGREDAARAQWRSALLSLERRQAADPAIATDPFFIAVKMFMGCLVGDPEKWAEAAPMLRLYVQFGGLGEFPRAWEPVRFFTMLGRQDILVDFFALALKSGDMPGLRENLRTNHLYDPLRGNLRFEALLAEPEVKK